MLEQTSARTDREALLILKDAINLLRGGGWGSDKPLSEWAGVTTDSNGRVTEIDIEVWDYEELPWELGNLAYLEMLHIRIVGPEPGKVIGEIPPEWGNLTNLKVLRLSNQNWGPSEASKLPPELGSLTNLEELCISSVFTLEIPPELGNLANLEVLCLRGLTGEIPPELGNLANLKELRLSGDLSGCVPFELRDQLTDYNYGFCADPSIVAEQMSVLAALYDATGGDDWYDNTNWLSDAELGEWYGVSTDGEGYITGLKLYENDLSGEIPAELGQLARLQSLYLYGNSLTGCIPASLEDQLTDAELGSLSYCRR